MKVFWLMLGLFCIQLSVGILNTPDPATHVSMGALLGFGPGMGTNRTSAIMTLINGTSSYSSTFNASQYAGSSLYIFGDIPGAMAQFISIFTNVATGLYSLAINMGAPAVWAGVFQTVSWLVYVAGLIEILGGRKVD